MSIQSDRTTNQPLGTPLAFEAEAASRKPWATPTVIEGELVDAELNLAGASDGGIAPNSLS
jgi:hypothetical protein